MTHCVGCGASIPEGSSSCPECHKQTRKTISNAWYIIPIFMGWLGGLLMYLVIRDDDRDKAKRGLIVGIIITLAAYVPAIVLIGSLSWLFPGF